MNSEELNELSKQIHSPVPFWFLNGYIEEWHIVRELEMMREKGIGDVVVHPRYGLQTEYLSEDWFRVFGWCVREAKKHGVHVWIYDELNWPSGTAGMTVMGKDPEFRGKYLAVERVPVGEIDFSSFQPGLHMVAANIEGGNVTKTRVIEDAAGLRALTGDWQIFNCTLSYDRFYIDTLSWAAVECFRQVTYDAYYERFGDEFGKTIRAIFTDEPSIYWVSVGYDDWNLPYTGDYFQTFEQRFGYAPIPMIPYLFYPGRDGTVFRADYWDHAGYLFNQRYHGTLGSWCRQRNIIYTGHDHHEEPLRYQIRFSGDMFGGMRAMDVPGVDHLGKQTLGNHWISIVGNKIASSEAHISGKARCMSESFGCMEWDTTFTNLKRVTDWQYALGINMLVPHAMYHTISSYTKRECPPSFFYQSPHWEDFGYFVEYVRRLEDMLCGGKHVCKVAVMYPSSGLWASYQSDRRTSEFEATDNFLNSLCLELVKNQVDWDFVDFPALRTATVENGRMLLAEEKYEYLLVPASAYTRREEVARLTDLVRLGVKTTLFHKAMEPIEHNVPDGLRGASFVRTEELLAYVEGLRRELDDDIQLVGGGADEIMAYRRERDGRKITFLLNRSEKHRKVTAMLKDYPEAAVFDQETGAWAKLDGRPAGRKLQAQLRFQPNQSYFIVSGVPDAPAAGTIEQEPAPIAVTNLRVEALFNVASLYHFSYTSDGHEPIDLDVRSNPRYVPVNWDPNVPDFEQFAGVYETEVEIEGPTEGVRLIIDKDFGGCEVYVNGTRIELAPCCVGPSVPAPAAAQPKQHRMPAFLTDLQDVWADVGQLLRPGTNRFRVVSPTKLSEPLRLVGDFRVRVVGTRVTVLGPGEVNPLQVELDYPFYSGTLTYRAEFELDRVYGALLLNLHDVHDAAEVRVNGSTAGKRLWAPYTLDIAALSRAGMNELEIEVRNNMANLLYGNPRQMGLAKAPTLAGV